jgi:hypothetical protein
MCEVSQSRSAFGVRFGRVVCSLAHLLEVSNPKLVVILGCFGLASNIVGLFLFHGMLFSFYCLSQEQCSPRYDNLSTLDLKISLF